MLTSEVPDVLRFYLECPLDFEVGLESDVGGRRSEIRGDSHNILFVVKVLSTRLVESV